MKLEKQYPLIAHENKYRNLSISLSKRKEFQIKQELKNIEFQNLKWNKRIQQVRFGGKSINSIVDDV